MEARSLFALVALLLVLWLIRTWYYWNSHTRLARRSREQLRRKLNGLTLTDRGMSSASYNGRPGHTGNSSEVSSPGVQNPQSVALDSAVVSTPTKPRPKSWAASESVPVTASGNRFATHSATRPDTDIGTGDENGIDNRTQQTLVSLRQRIHQRDETIRTLQEKLAENERQLTPPHLPAHAISSASVESAQSQEINALQRQLVESDQQLQRQEHAFQEIEKLKKNLFARQREIEQLQLAGKNNEQALEQYRSKAQRAAMLEQQLAESVRVCTAHEHTITQLQEQVDGMKVEPAGVGLQTSDKATLERLRQQLKDSQASARAAHQSDLELRRLRSELESMQSRNILSANRINDLEKRIGERQQSMAVARTQDHVSTDSVSKLRHALSEKEKQNALLQQQLDVRGKPGSNIQPERRKPLFSAPDGKDDLKLIKGIGPVMERTLNELGVTTFKQLANFSQNDIDQVSAAIDAFPGRIERDDWVGKAREHHRVKYGESA